MAAGSPTEPLCPTGRLTWGWQDHHNLLYPQGSTHHRFRGDTSRCASHQGVRERSCDLLEALALTGLRRNELATLTWELVDFQQGIIKIPAPRSKNGRPFLRPMTRRVREILRLRREQCGGQGLVFPGKDPARPILDLHRIHDAIRDRTGLEVTTHDLRRGFATAALRAGVHQQALKRLLNHLSGAHDVTAGYQILGMDDLRDASQLVEDHILTKAGLVTKRTDVARMVLGMSESERQEVLRVLLGPT